MSTQLKIKPVKLLRLMQQLNNFYLTGLQERETFPFLIKGQQVGYIKSNVLKELAKCPQVFCINDDCENTENLVVELNPEFENYAERTEQLNRVLDAWRQQDIFPTLKGWRDEYFEVRAEFEGLLKMERAATPLFGVRRYGTHINGFVKDPTKGLCIWLQQRSNTKDTWPGKWDNLVGGGLSVGAGIKATALKEAAEEASLSSALLNNLTSAGSVSMFFANDLGLYANTEYVFDLELPLDFKPHNLDGEVQAFELLPAADCIALVCSPEFKITSSPVIIDFLIRRSYIAPDVADNLFMQIIELLHVPLDSLYPYKRAIKNK